MFDRTFINTIDNKAALAMSLQSGGCADIMPDSYTDFKEFIRGSHGLSSSDPSPGVTLPLDPAEGGPEALPGQWFVKKTYGDTCTCYCD